MRNPFLDEQVPHRLSGYIIFKMSFINWIKRFPYTPAQIAVHVYAWSELVIIIYGVLTHHLTANPIQAMEIDTGRHAIALLVLSLACTPLTTLLGWRDLLKRRRALGLYAIMYAVLHVIIFMDLDNGIAWNLLNPDCDSKVLYSLWHGRFSFADSAGDDFLRHLEGPPRKKLEAFALGCVLHRAHCGIALCDGGER